MWKYVMRHILYMITLYVGLRGKCTVQGNANVLGHIGTCHGTMCGMHILVLIGCKHNTRRLICYCDLDHVSCFLTEQPTLHSRPKKDNSFWSHQHSKLTLWRVFFSRQNLMIARQIFVRPHTTQNKTLMCQSLMQHLKRRSNKGNQILHRRPS